MHLSTKSCLMRRQLRLDFHVLVTIYLGAPRKTGTPGGLMPEKFQLLCSADSAAGTGTAGSKGQGGGSHRSLVASRLTRVRPTGGRRV